ncbi:hypothetical protein DFH28DRAFT_1061094 [Melampsora americana]|nr:hypothetical protein DFH28DRAFT_1061094 [Melampsora americana]
MYSNMHSYHQSGSYQHHLDQFIPGIASSQLAPTMAPSQHPNSTVHIHTQNNNSYLGLNDCNEMEGEEDAHGETDEDVFNQEEETDREMSDDESENNDNKSRESMYLILSSRMNLS